jgi:pantothenate synthetase
MGGLDMTTKRDEPITDADREAAGAVLQSLTAWEAAVNEGLGDEEADERAIAQAIANARAAERARLREALRMVARLGRYVRVTDPHDPIVREAAELALSWGPGLEDDDE